MSVSLSSLSAYLPVSFFPCYLLRILPFSFIQKSLHSVQFRFCCLPRLLLLLLLLLLLCFYFGFSCHFHVSLLLSAIRLCFFSHSFAAVSSPLLIFMYGYFRICFIGHAQCERLSRRCCLRLCMFSISPRICLACHASKLLSLPIVMFCLFVCLLCACTTIWFMLLALSPSLLPSPSLFACLSLFAYDLFAGK